MKQHDNTKIYLPTGIERKFIAVLLFLAILWLTSKAFSAGRYELMVVAMVLPFVAILAGKLSWLTAVTLGLFLSRFYVPALPKSMELYHVFALLLLPLLGAAYCMRPPEISGPLSQKAMAIGFLAIIGITVYARGFGMSFLGSESWGGASYIYMSVAIMLLFLSDAVVLSQRQWKWVLILLFGGASMVALVSFLYFVSNGRIILPYHFIRAGESGIQTNLDVLLTGSEHVFRIQSAKEMFYLLVLSLAFLNYRGWRKLVIWGCTVIAVIGIGISGHRASVISFFIFLFSYGVLNDRRFPVRPLMLMLSGSAVMILVFAQWGTFFPLATQRAFSWLPFADISYVAEQSALDTLGRFDMWRVLATDFLPRYWLVGRGFAFRAQDLLAVTSTGHSALASFMITNNYHNGPLVLLVNLGVGGLFFGYALLLGGALRHYKLLKEEWINNNFAQYHKVMLSLFITSIIAQTAVGCGDWITRPLVFLIILEGLYRTNRWELSRAGAVSVQKSSSRRNAGTVPDNRLAD